MNKGHINKFEIIQSKQRTTCYFYQFKNGKQIIIKNRILIQIIKFLGL
jgi:hypothetical protein